MILNNIFKLKTRDIMATNVLKVAPDTPLSEVFTSMMRKNRQEALIIERVGEDREKILGIFTLKDISGVLLQGIDLNQTIKIHMHTNVYTFPPDQPAKSARDFMVKKGIGRLPVWDGKRVIGIVDTITLRDTFYKETEELSMQLREVIEQLHEGVCVVDDQGIVHLWNKSAERVYGVSAEELLGKKLKDYFPNALLDMVLESKEPVENVPHSPRKNTYVAISAKPLWFGDHLVGAVSSERDITEITQLSQKLEEANKRVEFLETEYQRIAKDQFQIGAIIGKSKKLTDAILLAQQVSKTNVNVLITGESGTGKEVFARAIHQESGRKGDFIAINCSAIPSNLLESELFGYEGGAFTGALSKGKKGKFQLADNGTIFLDEIGEMPPDMQAKLLRVIQEREIQPVGSEKTIKMNARIIAATNQDLESMMGKGLFREDLFYRLNVVSIHLPPLRERKEDIPLLINQFLEEFSQVHNIKTISLPPDILKILTDYEWKGNVRELKNAIERLVVLSNGRTVLKEMLPWEILKSLEKDKGKTDESPITEYDLEKVLAQTERKLITGALKISQGNKKKAAELLNIPRSTLYYKISQLGLED